MNEKLTVKLGNNEIQKYTNKRNLQTCVEMSSWLNENR